MDIPDDLVFDTIELLKNYLNLPPNDDFCHKAAEDMLEQYRKIATAELE